MKLWLKILIGVLVVLVVGVLAAAAVLRGGAMLARQFGWGDRLLGSPMMQGGYRTTVDNDSGCSCLDGDENGNYGPGAGGRSPMMGGQNWNNQRNQADNYRGMQPGMMGGQNWNNQRNQADNFRSMGPGMMGGQNWNNQPNQTDNFRSMRPGMMGGQNWNNQRNQADNFRGIGPGMMGGELVAVDKWVTVEGEVTAVDQNVLTLTTTDSKDISIPPMEWRFIQAQDFTAAKGDKISLSGFYNGDLFETGKITNTTSGDSVNLRDDSGLPLWAGRGNWR